MTSYQEAEGAHDRGIKGFSRYTSCLIPVIAAFVLLAAGVTAINFFIDSDTTVLPTDAGTDTVEDSPDASPTAAKSRRSKDQYSTEGILALITGLGWTQFGELAHYELGGRTRQTRKYRKDQAHISVTVYAFKSQKAAQKRLNTLGPKSRRVVFDHKIVVVEGLNPGGRKQVPDLVERLRRYRDMVGN